MTTPIHAIEVRVNMPCCSVCDTKMSNVHEGWGNSDSMHCTQALWALTLPCPRAALHGQVGLKMSTSYETKTDEDGFITKTIVTLTFSEPEVIDLTEDLVKTYNERRIEVEVRGKRKKEERDTSSPIEPYFESLSPTERATYTDSPPPLVATVQHV